MTHPYYNERNISFIIAFIIFKCLTSTRHSQFENKGHKGQASRLPFKFLIVVNFTKAHSCPVKAKVLYRNKEKIRKYLQKYHYHSHYHNIKDLK